MEPVPGEVPAQNVARRSAVPSWRELWQVPLFCIGVLSLVLVWTFRPAHARTMPAARAAYEKACLALDLDDLPSAERWLQNAELSSSDNSVTPYQLEFLRASTHLAQLRQHSQLLAIKPSEKQEYAQIRQKLEAITNAVSPQERPHLNYLLLVVKLATDGLDAKTLDQIEQLLDTDFIDRRDGYQLLSQSRLQARPPDLLGALRAIDRLLATPELMRPNAARLEKAKVLAQLEKWNDVIKVCHSIPVDAEEYATALQVRALAHFHLQQWSEAEHAWRLVKESLQTPSMLLHYGLSLQQLKNRTEAAKSWERLRITFPSAPETVKATLCLSQLSAGQGRWPDAVSYLVTVLRSQPPQTFQNPYASRDEIWQQVAECAESLIKLHRWEDVLVLAEPALAWSQKGLAESWLAQAWHNLAEADRNTAAVSKKEAYRLAAEFAWRAAKTPQVEAKEKWLELSGADALRIEKYDLAQRAYGEWLTVPPAPANRSAVLIGLADALKFQKQLDDARDRLREACKIPGEHEASAHLRLFHVFDLQKQRDDAEHELEEAAKLVTGPNHHPDAEEAAHLRMLYLYKCWVIDRKEVLRVVQAGEMALQYADKHPQAARTRYLLAEVLKYNAMQQLDEANTFPAGAFPLGKTAEQFLRALKYFQAAAHDFAQPDVAQIDVDAGTNMLRSVRLGQAESLYFLGVLARHVTSEPIKADACWLQAEQIFREIGAQSSSKVEVLYSRYWTAQCQSKRGLFGEMYETIRSGIQLLDEMTDSDFQQSPLIRPPWRSREDWKRLFEEELKKTQPIGP
jgi:tetratricopeptide (TPR) repeat protein